MTFKEEFEKLIKKYDVDISWTCDEASDTYWIYNDKIIISYEENGKDIYMEFEDFKDQIN